MRQVVVFKSSDERTIHLCKKRTEETNVSWWTVECSEVIKIKTRFLKKVRKSYSFDVFIRKVIRAAKINYWKEYCDKIGKNIDISEIWGMIRKMGGIQQSNRIPVLKRNWK